jgi:hypothetical protein
VKVLIFLVALLPTMTQSEMVNHLQHLAFHMFSITILKWQKREEHERI